MQVELDKGAGLSLGLEWIRRALYLTTFTAESLKTTVEQCLGRIPAAKRNGHGVASALLGSLVRDPDQSNTLVEHAIRQYPFLTRLSAQLATDEGSAAVLAAMGGLRTALLQPSRMNLFIAGDLTQLPDPYPALAAAIVPPAKTMSKTPPTGPFTGVSEKLLATGRTGQVVLCALSAVETHYVTVSAPGLGAYSPDHAALLVAIEYITALEGDFWVKLRGPGLTYSCTRPHDGGGSNRPRGHYLPALWSPRPPPACPVVRRCSCLPGLRGYALHHPWHVRRLHPSAARRAARAVWSLQVHRHAQRLLGGQEHHRGLRVG